MSRFHDYDDEQYPNEWALFIDRVLARPPLQRPAPKPKREPRRRPSPAGASGMPSLELGL